jgi:hypothetical protein
MIMATVMTGGISAAQKHKSETEIINLTPAARVDEWVNEQVHHRFDLDDDQSDLIRKYLLREGRSHCRV